MNRAISTTLFLAFLSLIFSAPVYAKTTASIADVDLFNTGKRLVVDVSLQDGFSEDVVEAIKSGVPLGITYTVVLKRNIPILVDKKIVTRTIKKYVKYDTLKEHYKIIESNGKRLKKKIIMDFDEVTRVMTHLDSIHLVSNKWLEKKGNYYVSVKAELSSKKQWFPFNYILFFVSYLSFDTSWKNSSSFTFK